MSSKHPSKQFGNNPIINPNEIQEINDIIGRMRDTLTYIAESNPELLLSITNKGSVFLTIKNLLNNLDRFIISFSFCVFTGQLSSKKRVKEFDIETFSAYLSESMLYRVDSFKYSVFPEPFHKNLNPEFIYISLLFDEIYFSNETENLAQDFLALGQKFVKLNQARSLRKTDYVVDALLFGISKYVDSCVDFNEAQRLKSDNNDDDDELSNNKDTEWDIESDYYLFSPRTIKTCSHCGGSEQDKYTEDAFGHLICLKCLSELFRKCTCCGQIVHVEDTESIDEKVYCEECYFSYSLNYGLVSSSSTQWY